MNEKRTKSKQLQDNQHGGQRWSNLGLTSIPEKIFNHWKYHKIKNYSLNDEVNLYTEKTHNSKTKIDAYISKPRC